MKTKVYLCKVFGIDGKLGKYKDIYNNVAIFDDKNNLTQLMEYNKQDCKALYDSLLVAQSTYLRLYKVDIADIVSTSSLAIRIYRTNYQDVDIPILSLTFF